LPTRLAAWNSIHLLAHLMMNVAPRYECTRLSCSLLLLCLLLPPLPPPLPMPLPMPLPAPHPLRRDHHTPLLRAAIRRTKPARSPLCTNLVACSARPCAPCCCSPARLCARSALLRHPLCVATSLLCAPPPPRLQQPACCPLLPSRVHNQHRRCCLRRAVPFSRPACISRCSLVIGHGRYFMVPSRAAEQSGARQIRRSLLACPRRKARLAALMLSLWPLVYTSGGG